MKRVKKLTKEHLRILKQSSITLALLSEARIVDIMQHPLQVATLSDSELVEFLKIANALYRGGSPIISDPEYDSVYIEELKKRNPQHEFLKDVEPESAFEGAKLDLPVQMYSTEKRTSKESIAKWLKAKQNEAQRIGLDVSDLRVRVTPKLDGFAAYDDGKILYTRGDGRKGTDISRVFRRGLSVAGDKRGKGPGEIVVDKEYFEKYLSGHFENPRNFQAAIIKEKTLDPYVDEAIKEKAALFFPFSELPAQVLSIADLKDRFEEVVEKMWNSVPYDVDGVVLEITDPRFKEYVKSTSQHHRWQVAYKTNEEKAQVKVISVIPQTSRAGRITPVAELEPTKLSGVTISRATAHHYGMVKAKGIGPNAVIELVRSGMVIPKIEKVIHKSIPQIPPNCPSCDSLLTWDGDNLICTNVGSCPAQIINTIEHFFKTLRNVDGFGLATIEKLFSQGVKTIYDVYMLQEDILKSFGFGDKQAQNLVSELKRSRAEPLEDWRFLAAFGAHRLGLASCEHLLKHVKLSDIFSISIDQIITRKIFANKTAEIIVRGLRNIKTEFTRVFGLGFNLEYSNLLSEMRTQGVISPITEKQLVFTGSMQHGSRIEMEKEARILGAKVGKTVTGKTDLLITGEDVGAKKIELAITKGVKVISEQEYLDLISRHVGNQH